MRPGIITDDLLTAGIRVWWQRLLCCLAGIVFVAGCTVVPEPFSSEDINDFAARNLKAVAQDQEPVKGRISLYEAMARALVKAEEAKNAGDTAAFDKWTQAAQSQALKLQAAENNLNGLKDQYEMAVAQSDDAKRAVQQNAMRLQELAAKRMELLGRLEQAKMQEAVNQAVESISVSTELETPSLDKVQEKIDARLANAKATAELREATPEGAEAELREAISLAGADEKLEELRAELGLTE